MTGHPPPASPHRDRGEEKQDRRRLWDLLHTTNQGGNEGVDVEAVNDLILVHVGLGLV
jgi:hypothetical protein